MNAELKPCPFCGERGAAYASISISRGTFMACSSCSCLLGYEGGDDVIDEDGTIYARHRFANIDEAIAAWNTRAS